MKRYIIDTSVTAKLFLDNEPHKDIAIEVFRLADKRNIELLAPSLILYELNNVLVKERATYEDVSAALAIFNKYIEQDKIKIISSDILLLNKAAIIATTDTAGQGYISSYDATFHALALQENAVFLTADKSHYEKTKDRIGSVLLLESFNYEK
jgi:predicted nucleic acid-binding protein